MLDRRADGLSKYGMTKYAERNVKSVKTVAIYRSVKHLDRKTVGARRITTMRKLTTLVHGRKDVMTKSAANKEATLVERRRKGVDPECAV